MTGEGALVSGQREGVDRGTWSTLARASPARGPVRGTEVVEDDGVELAMALSADQFDEVFVLFELRASLYVRVRVC